VHSIFILTADPHVCIEVVNSSTVYVTFNPWRPANAEGLKIWYVIQLKEAEAVDATWWNVSTVVPSTVEDIQLHIDTLEVTCIEIYILKEHIVKIMV